MSGARRSRPRPLKRYSVIKGGGALKGWFLVYDDGKSPSELMCRSLHEERAKRIMRALNRAKPAPAAEGAS